VCLKPADRRSAVVAVFCFRRTGRRRPSLVSGDSGCCLSTRDSDCRAPNSPATAGQRSNVKGQQSLKAVVLGLGSISRPRFLTESCIRSDRITVSLLCLLSLSVLGSLHLFYCFETVLFELKQKAWAVTGCDSRSVLFWLKQNSFETVSRLFCFGRCFSFV